MFDAVYRNRNRISAAIEESGKDKQDVDRVVDAIYSTPPVSAVTASMLLSVHNCHCEARFHRFDTAVDLKPSLVGFPPPLEPDKLSTERIPWVYLESKQSFVLCEAQLSSVRRLEKIVEIEEVADALESDAW
ncbi:hypothetical protein VF21_03997 [Pseudogymnoascus sp. 05NY08]|nr:hypothetical protein VF21_03997 [Pseudogymnoascus sp. 05NY08]